MHRPRPLSPPSFLAALLPLILSLPMPGAAWAQTGDAPPGGVTASTPALTLDAAQALARRHHPRLAAAQRELEAAEGLIQQAGASPNPQLEMLLEDTRRETRTTTLQWSQPVELGGKRSARVKAAQSAQAQSALALAAARADLRADVAKAFHELAINQERVRLAQASNELARRALEATTRRVTAGKVSPVEQTRAQVAEAHVRMELARAQGQWRSSVQHLRSLVWPQGPGPALAVSAPTAAPAWGGASAWAGQVDAALEPLPPAPELASLQARLEHSVALAQARLEVGSRRALVAVEQAQRVPDVTFTIGAKRPEEIGRHQAVLGLAIPIPVGDSNRGALLAASRRLDQAEAQLSATQNQLGDELQRLAERLAASRDEVITLRQDVLPGADSAFQAAMAGFELGKFGFLDMLDAQRTVLQARTQYLQALDELHRTNADLERLLAPVDDPQDQEEARP